MSSPIDTLYLLVGAPNALEVMDDAMKARDAARRELATAREAAICQDLTGAPSLQVLRERYIRHVLLLAGDNKTKAAKVLGVDRRTLYRHIAAAKRRAAKVET